MVRTYKRKLGARNYKNYSDEDLAKAVAEVRAGIISQAGAAKKYKINRTTILNRIHHRHEGLPGHPHVLTSQSEKLIADRICVLADWGFPCTKADIRIIVQMFINREGRIVKQWKDNLPGYDYVNEFAARNNLTQRLASNIKTSRASVSPNDIKQFFENLRPALEETRPALIYNYDETNITDDPGAVKVLVRRGHKRVERIQEHSKSSISIMFCGTAEGQLIPPMVVYKSKHLYDHWTQGGPPGTIYRNSSSGWFDMNLFEIWFFKVLLPHIQEHREENEKAVVIGDNLASHFSQEVISAALENNIYFTTLTPNSTHMMQPLDVGVYGPLKKQWRKVLDNWRKESRIRGAIPKPHFPMLLKRLMDALAPNIKKNLQSSFRTTGLCPFDPEAVLKKLPADHSEETGRVLDSSLLDFLKETRGYNSERSRHRRGKKVIHEPGTQISIIRQGMPSPASNDVPEMENEDSVDDTVSVVMEVPIFEPTPSTSSLPPTTKQTSSDDDIPLSNFPHKRTLRGKRKNMEKSKKENNLCHICKCDFRFYHQSADWICCITCKNWICGICNKGSTNPFYECMVCEDTD